MDETDIDDAPKGKEAKSFIQGDYRDIKNRGLKEAICRKYSYEVGEYQGTPCHIANVYDPVTRKLIFQKLRFPKNVKGKKPFAVLGNGRNAPFIGQHLFSGGKSVVITEGEIDMLTVAQVMGMGKWPVVSLPNGSNSAKDTIIGQREWLDKFEKVILCFDNDKAGQEALEAALPHIPLGKAFVMTLPLKDPNEVLLEMGPEPISQAYWNAQAWRPDGIIHGSEISLQELKAATSAGYATRLPVFNEKYGGIRKREILLLTAGSGIGKSTLAREIAYGLHQDHGLTIGNVYLEESHKKTAQGYIAIDNNVPLGKLRANPDILTDEQWASSKAKVIDDRMVFYNHFGSLESDRLLAMLRYMATVLMADFIVLDHISIVVSGSEGSGEGERRDIDMLMTKLRSLVEETGVGIIAIVHLKQPEGRAHEEGGRVTLSQLRGSGSLKQLTDGVAALERDQQGDNSAVSLLRLLKNREFGDTGECDHIRYDKQTGRMIPETSVEEYSALDV